MALASVQHSPSDGLPSRYQLPAAPVALSPTTRPFTSGAHSPYKVRSAVSLRAAPACTLTACIAGKIALSPPADLPPAALVITPSPMQRDFSYNASCIAPSSWLLNLIKGLKKEIASFLIAFPCGFSFVFLLPHINRIDYSSFCQAAATYFFTSLQAANSSSSIAAAPSTSTWSSLDLYPTRASAETWSLLHATHVRLPKSLPIKGFEKGRMGLVFWKRKIGGSFLLGEEG